MQTVTNTSAPVAIHESTTSSQKRNTIIFWTLTWLLFGPGTIGAFAEAFTNGPASIVKITIVLGFPLFVMKILGVAKILGGIAILSGKLPRMKEWAYGGFTFDFLGATAAHVMTGDRMYALFPLTFFLILRVCYLLWYKTAATPLPFGNRA